MIKTIRLLHLIVAPILVLALLVISPQLTAQVEVRGLVKDVETNRPLAHAFVINQRTQNGVFCDMKGKFSIEVKENDSLLISLTGYTYATVILSDSIAKPAYQIEVALKLKPIQLRTFTMKAPKTFEQIIKELEDAEARKVARTPVANALESPITFLYNQFSKEGKARRKIAELQSQDAKEELMRELFTRYMVAHLIDLDEKDLSDFIRFSGLTNSYHVFDTEYELVVYVKERYEDYKQYRGIQTE